MGVYTLTFGRCRQVGNDENAYFGAAYSDLNLERTRQKIIYLGNVVDK